MKIKHLLIELFLIAMNILLLVTFVYRVGARQTGYMLVGIVLGTLVSLLFFKPKFRNCRMMYEQNGYKVDFFKCSAILVLILFFLILTAIFRQGLVFGLMMGFTVCAWLIRFSGDLLYSVIIHNDVLNDMLKKRFKWLR